MRTREIRSCIFLKYHKNTASCNCKRKQKQRQRKPKASENKRYTQANKEANTKETKEKLAKPKASKHKQNKDKSNQHRANIQAKRREHKQKQWHTPVTTCQNKAEASKHKQPHAKTIKGTDTPALIQSIRKMRSACFLTYYERSFYMRHNSKPIFTTTATTITNNIVEFASMRFQFEITIMHYFAH